MYPFIKQCPASFSCVGMLDIRDMDRLLDIHEPFSRDIPTSFTALLEELLNDKFLDCQASG